MHKNLMKDTGKKEQKQQPTVFGKGTKFNGVLHFRNPLCIQGAFMGTIQGEGPLVIDKGAIAEVDRVAVASLIVMGTVRGPIFAADKVDMLPGSMVIGDVETSRLRIGDNVIFEGSCRMTDVDEKDLVIFARPIKEIKAELRPDVIED
jgi:cytoskeletal protein CcmA (bactofilin family)